MGGFDAATGQEILEQAFAVSLQLPAAVDTPYAGWRELSRVLAALVQARGAKVVAVSGSQGSGKTTLSNVLTRTCQQMGINTLSCSIDDFYLSRADRTQLARQVHPLLQTRGVPGTHEWHWLQSVLQAVREGGAELRLPVFDKGRDDRKGTITAEVDTLVLEGWCLGVTAQPDNLLADPVNDLERDEDPQGIWRGYVNDQIRDHYESLWTQVDLWVHLRVPSFTQVVHWRTQQEQQLPASQRMSEPEILRFIQHYERLTRWLWASVPLGPGVVVRLDEAHQVAEFAASRATRITA